MLSDKKRDDSLSPAKEFSDGPDEKCLNGYDISLGVERVEDLIELEAKD